MTGRIPEQVISTAGSFSESFVCIWKQRVIRGIC